MSQVRLPREMTPVFNELAKTGGAYPAFTGRSIAYIASLLIEQSTYYLAAKERLEGQPPKQLGKKR